MSYSAVNMEENEIEPLLYSKHAKYFVRFLNLMPARVANHDSTRGSILFFAVCGLDVLNSLNSLTTEMRINIIDWLYGGLVVPKPGERCCSGFMGSRSNVVETDDPELQEGARYFQFGHLAMTYTALGVLITLGDDLSRLDRKTIVDGVAAVQRPDGSFSACIDGSENDMRFVYCAAAICHMLNYWGNVDKEKMFQYIKNSLRYDNGFSQHLEGEAHGGTTFCALAALDLSGQLDRFSDDIIEGIKRWLVFRQDDGFQGRPNKPVDTCYSFWIGAALKILDAFDLTDRAANRRYIMETQDKVVGGFAKWPQTIVDPFHTYFGLCGLSFTKEPGLAEVMPSLNLTMNAYRRLKEIHKSWEHINIDDNVNKNIKTILETTTIAKNDTAPSPETKYDKETVTSPLISAQ